MFRLWPCSVPVPVAMLITCLLLAPFPALGRHYLSTILSTSSPSIFVFGASLVDAGENAVAMPLRSYADFSPYGSDNFGKPVGRWSNGRTLMDFITEALGYGHLSPYLQTIGSNFTHGANFASSGSTASNSSATGTNSGGLFCLLLQVDQFRDFQASVISSQRDRQSFCTTSSKTLLALISIIFLTGLKAKENMRTQFSDSIYFFETGLNDYTSTAHSDSEPLDVNTTVLATIAAMKSAFQTLYGVGARTFIVMNLNPFGCTPLILTNPGTGVSEDLDENNCNAFWMNVVATHNAHLNLLLDELRTEYPGAEWILFDAYSMFLDGYINPSKYGIEYPFHACCGAGGPYNVNANVFCGQEAQTINGTIVAWTKCEDPTLYLIWDYIHPVESFAYHAAQGVLNGTFLIPSLGLAERVQAFQDNLSARPPTHPPKRR